MTKPPIVDVTEQKRLNEAREAHIPWKKWRPYLSERQWGTVREDYSEDGNAWDYFTHDHARSRAIQVRCLSSVLSTLRDAPIGCSRSTGYQLAAVPTRSN